MQKEKEEREQREREQKERKQKEREKADSLRREREEALKKSEKAALERQKLQREKRQKHIEARKRNGMFKVYSYISCPSPSLCLPLIDLLSVFTHFPMTRISALCTYSHPKTQMV